MRSPGLTKSGTCTTAPVSSVAGFVTFDTVSPFTPGSVSVTVSSTEPGSCTPDGFPPTTSICTLDDGCMYGSASSSSACGSENCSYVSSSMKCTSEPSSYRYCTFFVSVKTRANFSPARNVLSTTEPLSTFFTFVRTNAPPLPGFTCWNSTMRQTPPSSSMCMPFLNWFVETVSAIRRPRLADGDELLGGLREDLGLPVRDRDEVFDPHAGLSLEVD